MKRREFIAGIGAAVAWPVCVSAQTSAKVWRIGFLAGSWRANVAETGLASAFVQGMREARLATADEVIE